MRAATSAAVAVATAVSAIVFAPSASAKEILITEMNIWIDNCNVIGEGQFCPSNANVKNSEAITRQYTNPAKVTSIKLEFIASPRHCSDIIAHAYFDGQEWGSDIAGPVLTTGVLTAAIACAGLALASPASAKPFTQDNYIDVPQCAQPQTQLCAQIPSATVGAVMAPSVSFTANNNHCSDMIAHVIVDGQEVGADRVGPGQSTRVFDLASFRSHTVGVQAEGVEGGCNVGYVGAWGGTLHFKGTSPLS